MEDNSRPSIRSSALEANLAQTAATVKIPADFTPLLDAARPHFGLYSDLEKLLSEYFHPFRNTTELLEGLARQVLGRWFQYAAKPNREELFDLFVKLLWDLIPSLKSPAKKEEALRVLFAFWGDTLASKHGELLAPTVAKHLNLLPNSEIPVKLLVKRDNQLQSLAPRFFSHKATADVYGYLYRQVLANGIQTAGEKLDFMTWAEDNPGLAEDIDTVRAAFRNLNPEKIAQYKQALENSLLSTDNIKKIPTLSALVAESLKALSELKDPSDCFQASLYLLKDDTTGPRQNELISLLLDVLNRLMKSRNEDQIERIIYQLTQFLKRRADFSPDVRFTIYERIGVAIGNAGSVRLSKVLTDNLLSWPFEEPNVSGATLEWKMIANPYHLHNIRTFLTIISSNPPLFRRLIASLTLSLRFGGVYIPDTALMQKDISRLLASNIEPVYHHVRQLCFALPVFFSELGAEGELRTLSTTIDQVSERQDSIIHFLRKSVHAETNNLLVPFAEHVLKYWHTGDATGLLKYLPNEMQNKPVEEREFAQEPHRIMQKLVGDGNIESLLCRSREDIRATLDIYADNGFPHNDVERVFCLIRVVQLLREKYNVAEGYITPALLDHYRIPKELITRFVDAQSQPEEYAHLDAVFAILIHLRDTILSRETTSASENIYYKRHVAAGIPSMYGEYREPRFDALGLSFRIEAYAKTIFAKFAVDFATDYLSKEFLASSTRLLKRFKTALDIDGLLRDSYTTAVNLLSQSVVSHRINYYQLRNILKHFVAGAVSGVVEGPIFGEYIEASERIFRNKTLTKLPDNSLGPTAFAEMAVREMLSSTFGLQDLDNFVSRIVLVADELAHALDADRLSRILNFRSSRLITFIHDESASLDDPMHLGSKGFSLKRMASYGHQIPRGFMISTELFSVRDALSFSPLNSDVERKIFDAIARLEKETGKKIGDASNLLMLSVRSSSARSMPGMMTTFLNVGLNDEIVEKLSRKHNYGWTSWDCYRRFLQCWGMDEGIGRDAFDNIMADFKNRYNVKQKIEFSSNAMREMAYTYKERVKSAGIEIPSDPREQVLGTARKVLSSWDNEQARLFRRQMDIAEEWGTAVIVQQMVLGNINYDSGTGVVFTHSPRTRGLDVELEGDYVFCSQGEDLVAGLVFPLPITEKQKREKRSYRETAASLETHLPAIYNKLVEVASELVMLRGFEHQEIEFTFESSRPSDLFILQSRPMVFDDEVGGSVFIHSDEVWRHWLAAGLGCGGGAFTGRLALCDEHIANLSKEHPNDPLLLVRPDTVPEDITLIVKAKGLLTARGGGTSHAAITAKTLGRICVVNCRAMEVDEAQNEVRLAGKKFLPGDWLSINGDTGDIYAGKHEVQSRRS